MTYEISVFNDSDFDGVIALRDFMPSGENQFVDGILREVSCVSTSGSASCFDIQHTNIGVLLDGEPDVAEEDIFWQILPEDNWELPSNSGVVFQVVVEWFPQCNIDVVSSVNGVEVNFANGIIDTQATNNRSFASTDFVPCIDLVVQTYPEFAQIGVNQTFDWVIDISNSITSSEAVNINFENSLNPVFETIGAPTCVVTSGTASCIDNFNVSTNEITGTIPNMSAGSTVQIRIPVIAPSFGGAFNNTAEAMGNSGNNQELTPDTNISINNAQIIAPRLTKVFDPQQIIFGQESLLVFEINNLSNNPLQENITFLDNLPLGIVLASDPFWQNSNGSSGVFIGNIGDTFVGVSNLSIPDGTASVSFAVWVTGNTISDFINNTCNMSELNNIDASQVNATLTIIEDPSDVDIQILKEVFPTEINIGETVTFTISATNLGTTTATAVEITDRLPNGYEFVSAQVTNGSFDESSLSWNLEVIQSSETEILTIEARVVSSDELENIAVLENLNELDRNEMNNSDTAEVEISNCLQVPQGISPNNDGDNDYLVIPCIENYPDNNLKIFNRLGSLVYQASGYLNNWSGVANTGLFHTNTVLPVGTYYYILEIDSISKPQSGYVYINY